MGHEIKRSKNSNDSYTSDISSLSTDRCSLLASISESKTQECLLGTTPEEQVFGIDWIREEILSYLIYNSQENTCRKLITNIRLVQKAWLSTTTKLLKRCANPLLIELTLDNNDPLNDPLNAIKENQQRLNQFIERFGASNRLKESFVPCKLKLGSEFFRYENYQSLSDFFTRFGSEILELEIIYPMDGGNMPVNFPPFHFPILRKVSFQFSDNFYIPLGEDPCNFPDNRFGLWLLQSILNGSQDLQELIIPSAEADDDMVPATFEFLQLPPSIVSLQLGLELESKILETFLGRNQLPNLIHLTLNLHEKPFSHSLMHKILKQFRKTLTSFHAEGQRNYGRPCPRSYLKFPLMEKLEFINIYSTECELVPGQLTKLQECLPKLNRIYVSYQTEDMLKKWVVNSRFEGVKDLFVGVINEHLLEQHNNFFRSPSKDIMVQLNSAFPNVSSLTLHINIGFLNVLGYLFSNMRKLKFLEIRMHGKIQRNSSDLLDSIFTGIPLSLVSALKENGVDILETVLVLTNSGSQSTIRNLSELTNLTLWSDSEMGGPNQLSLLTDLLFGQAFLKMRKLRYLYLHEIFEPSASMQKYWEEKGRFISYSTQKSF